MTVSYPHSALRQAVLNAALAEDEDWFLALFSFAVRRGVDISQDQLLREVYAAAIRESKWVTIKVICEGIRLPEYFLDSILMPDVT